MSAPSWTAGEGNSSSRDHDPGIGSALVQCGADLWLNRDHIVSMEWDRRHYMNGPSHSALVVVMVDGTRHRIAHEPHLIDGTDAYAIEKALTNA